MDNSDNLELDSETTNIEESEKTTKVFEWNIDNCIKLLEKRKSMEEVFVKTYQTSSAWVKLIRECEWDLDWKIVRNKFANLKRQGIPRRIKKPKTGQEGDIGLAEKVNQLSDLLFFFTDGSHKYNPPKIIDTSAKETISDSDSFDTNKEPNNNVPPVFDWLPDDDNPLPQADEINDDVSSIHMFSQPLSTASTSSYEASSQPDSYIMSRQRKKIPGQRELIAKSLQNIKEISHDIRRYTDATLDFYEFLKKKSSNQNLDFQE